MSLLRQLVFWLPLRLVLLAALLAGRSAAGQPGQSGAGRPVGTQPLPPALAALLPANEPISASADIARLQAARGQWQPDSLGRLLVYSRLAADFGRLHQPDSAYRYLLRAWYQAGPAQRQRQPAEVITLAHALGDHYYACGAFDSTRHYFQQACHLVQAAHLDSTRWTYSLLPSTHYWGGGGELPGLLTNAGAASRALNNLPEALRYYERARPLFHQQRSTSGECWAQCLMGEAYAEEGNSAQAQAQYEQALETARALCRREPGDYSSQVLVDILLSYYGPLLLTLPNSSARITPLVTEVMHTVLAADTPPARSVQVAQQLVGLSLLPAQAALQAGHPAQATPWLTQARRYLPYATRPDLGTPTQPDLVYELRAVTVGLLAWQQHTANPAEARRQLAEAVTLLNRGSAANLHRTQRRQLAGFCLAMHEPTLVGPLLWPLLRSYRRSGSSWPLSQVTALLARAYAQAGRYDSAYFYGQRTQYLTDTVREMRQFAALAGAEAHYRNREQAGRIALLTRLSAEQVHYTWLAGTGTVLLAMLALGLGLAWRTTRHLNRQLAAQAAQLGELDAAKNQFFANVSHELRTPLTLVLGPLDRLLTAPSRPLPGFVREPLALVYGNAQRLHELVNRILDLTKLEAGRLELRPVPTALAALLRRVVAQFGSLAAERRVALVAPTTLPPESLYVNLDADKLEQILTNLLANALRHTPAGGAVTVSLSLPDAKGLYALTVRDTGPGIAAAEQARVFERYYQSPLGPTQGGTGLGLALSRELAVLLGGALTLVSESGQGAAFTLTFPAPAVTAPAALPETVLPALPQEAAPSVTSLPAPPDPSTLDSQRPRILLVEDQADLRDYLRQLLASTCEVLTAEDGQAALEVLAREVSIDLVATDAMMPRLSGTELLARLRAEPAWQSLPVLMLTARADEAHRTAALTSGVDDYLTKPFTPAELLTRVRTLLTRQQVRRHFATLPPEEVVAAAPAPPPAALTSVTSPLTQWQAQAAPLLADSNFGPAELAALLCLSERTLYRRLGELAGLTPAAWLRELRLNHARRLFEVGGYTSVAEVAEAAGFPHVKSFSQRYTERFGCRPSDYYRSSPKVPSID